MCLFALILLEKRRKSSSGPSNDWTHAQWGCFESWTYTTSHSSQTSGAMNGLGPYLRAVNLQKKHGSRNRILWRTSAGQRARQPPGTSAVAAGSHDEEIQSPPVLIYGRGFFAQSGTATLLGEMYFECPPFTLRGFHSGQTSSRFALYPV